MTDRSVQQGLPSSVKSLLKAEARSRTPDLDAIAKRVQASTAQTLGVAIDPNTGPGNTPDMPPTGSDAPASTVDSLATTTSTASTTASAAASIGAKKVATIALLSALAGGAVGGAATYAIIKEEVSGGNATPRSASPNPENSRTAEERSSDEKQVSPETVRKSELKQIEPHRKRTKKKLAMPPEKAAATKDNALAPGDNESERTLIERANVAQRSHQFHEALVATMKHQRLYPHGEFAEERERIAIESLLGQKKTELARTRLARFARKYPKSIHLTRLKARFDVR